VDEVKESRRSKLLPYGLLSSSFHMVLEGSQYQAVSRPVNTQTADLGQTDLPPGTP